MKSNLIPSVFGTALVLTTFLGSSFSLHAQTFRGSKRLTDSPATFSALVYPVQTRQQTIRINVDNPDGAMIHTVITNENGNVVYDEYDTKVARRDYYNLAALPLGDYVVTLRTERDCFAKSFTIASSGEGYVTMGDRPIPAVGEFQTRRQLVVRE